MAERLYERRLGESDRAWEAFRLMRDTLPRQSITEIARRLSRKTHPATVQNWASKFDWAPRLKAWDDRIKHEVDDAIVHEHVIGAQVVVRRTLEHADKLHTLVGNELNKLLEMSQTEECPIVKPSTLVQLITLAMKLDHVLSPDDAVDATPGDAIDYADMDQSDLKELHRIAKKIGAGKEKG